LEAGRLITAEEAERRVLVLENPAFQGQAKATSSLYAGVQLILPGETARSHRHTAAALRLVLEGSGAFTAVDGERAIMRPGDFIITPSGTFHDHGNEGPDPVIWLDGLDVFIVNLLNAPFAEDHSQRHQPVRRPEGASQTRFSNGLLPHGFVAGDSGSGVFVWPYERTRDALFGQQAKAPIDAALGWKSTYIDPATGRSPIRTMTAAMQLFPRSFAGQGYRSIAGAVMTVVEGHGEIEMGSRRWSLAPHDVFIVPSWCWHRFTASEDLVLFSFSDEVLQRHLGYWREETRQEPEIR
jgi:gentisate 1,2-dioxygenase